MQGFYNVTFSFILAHPSETLVFDLVLQSSTQEEAQHSSRLVISGCSVLVLVPTRPPRSEFSQVSPKLWMYADYLPLTMIEVRGSSQSPHQMMPGMTI